MTSVTTTDSGTVTSAIRASSQLIHSIMARTPTTVSTDVTIWLKPCCSVVAMLSTSFVTRLKTSPCECLSKYLRGRRASFASTSRRIPYTVRWATPAMM